MTRDLDTRMRHVPRCCRHPFGGRQIIRGDRGDGWATWRLPTVVRGAADRLTPSIDDEFFGRQPSATRELPDPRPLLENLTRCVIEIIAGARDLEQIARWVDDDVYKTLLKRVVLSARARQATGRAPTRPVVRDRLAHRLRAARRCRRGGRRRARTRPRARGRHPARGPRPPLAGDRHPRALGAVSGRCCAGGRPPGARCRACSCR